MCTCQLFSFCYKKTLLFNYHRPSHEFSFGTHFCKPVMQHPVQWLKYQDFCTTSIQMKWIILFAMWLDPYPADTLLQCCVHVPCAWLYYIWRIRHVTSVVGMVMLQLTDDDDGGNVWWRLTGQITVNKWLQ